MCTEYFSVWLAKITLSHFSSSRHDHSRQTVRERQRHYHVDQMKLHPVKCFLVLWSSAHSSLCHCVCCLMACSIMSHAVLSEVTYTAISLLRLGVLSNGLQHNVTSCPVSSPTLPSVCDCVRSPMQAACCHMLSSLRSTTLPSVCDCVYCPQRPAV